MQSQLRSLADTQWELTASALESPLLKNEDLERLLQFLLEVNDVLFKAFHPLKVCLQKLADVPITGKAIDGESISSIVDELTEIQKREYYNVRLVCNRLHGLHDHARKHIQRIIAKLPNAGEWWSLFSRLDEREGFVEYIVREETEDLTEAIRRSNNAKSLFEAQSKAKTILSDVSSAINDMESYHALLYSGADRIGFLALTDLSRTSLRQQVHIAMNGGTLDMSTGDTINITDSTNVNVKSTLTNVQQAVNAMPVGSDVQKQDLQKLLQELSDELSKAPMEKSKEAETVAKRASQLVDAAGEDKPDASILKSIANGLKGAAEFVKDAIPSVVTIAGQIVSLIGNIHGIPI